ncbi:hypothetical protein IJ114_02765 [Candidatus Saccharibacteria bacterium]|nr:hypothetical protein [Candidatus Saccharibacteria bacterium]
MQLIRALLIAATIIVLLSGFSVFFGSRKQEKKSAKFFLLAALGAATWTIAVMIALDMPWASSEFVRFIVTCIIGSITICDVGLLAFFSYGYAGGKTLTSLFAFGGAILVALLAYDPSLFYSSYDLSNGYVQLYTEQSWHFYVLIAYFFLISITFSSYLIRRIEDTTNPGLKNGLKILLCGLSIGGILALLFDLVFLTTLPTLTWIGPLATVVSILSFYYSVVKYHTLDVSSKWMKAMSSVILVGTAVIVYLTVFYVITRFTN